MNLELHIHITRESSEKYLPGRFNTDTIPAEKNTEWYMCGSPEMITEATNQLKKRGFTDIFSEKF